LKSQNDDGITVEFRISDTGIGIADDMISNIFLPFTQIDTSTTKKFRGTGLGLAISRQLTELMGGSIGVKSIKGAGSEFWFTVLFAPAKTEERSGTIP
ncbi:MAG: hybrid sensor histidine kinase/response regulator, partial [Oligoflexales bacterium]|nr:hybrid sensor histidine kinase/response regulator [Oligoflexales bacterium]